MEAEPVGFDLRPWRGERIRVDAAATALRLGAVPTGALGTEPTVRSTGDALLLTGSREVLRSADLRTWDVVHRHPLTFDPVLVWDPVRQQAVKIDLDASFACAHVSTASDGGTSWTQQRPACSATMDYLKAAAGPRGPSPNPLASSSVTYLCHNAAPPANPCLVSHDGAVTFAPMPASVPAVPCGGITSYPVVRQDGVVVLPVHGPSCQGPSFLVSRDSGLSWQPLAGPADHLASAGPGYSGSMASADFDGERLVVSWESEDGVYVAYSDDLASWSVPVLVRVPGVRAYFNALQAGNGSTALAFLGEKGGEWHLYAGLLRLGPAPTGTLLRLSDPVQRGEVCVGSTCLAGRNMGDFITSTTHQGDFVVGFADGCVACGSTAQSKDQLLSVARLRGAAI